MFCSYCGAHNLDTATVCQRCGKQIGIRRDEQAPPPPPPLSMPAGQSFTSVLTQRKNRGYVIAGSGALVALYAFFFLPYSATYTDTFGHETLTASNSGLGHGLLWIELLLALATLVVAARLMFGSNPFGMTTTSLATQTRWGVRALIGSGILSILIQLLITLMTNIEFQSGPDIGFYLHFDVGYWVYMLAMAVVLVGGVIAQRTLASSLPPQPQRWQQPPSAR